MMTLAIVLNCSNLCGQSLTWGFQDINPEGIRDNPLERYAYSGSYHFGESEAEWTLLIIVDGADVYAQRRSGSFYGDAKGNMGWQWSYDNLNDCVIEGNLFSSEGWSGRFVTYENTEGLLLFVKGYEDGQFGSKIGEVQQHFSGDYPEVSCRLLTESDLENRSKEELKIMRNEVFARYGWKFKAGGEMAEYFSKLAWYQVREIDGQFLSELEKRNLELIQQWESKH